MSHPPAPLCQGRSDVAVLQLFRGRLISPFGKRGADHWGSPFPAARCTWGGSGLDSHGDGDAAVVF